MVRWQNRDKFENCFNLLTLKGLRSTAMCQSMDDFSDRFIIARMMFIIARTMIDGEASKQCLTSRANVLVLMLTTFHPI